MNHKNIHICRNMNPTEWAWSSPQGVQSELENGFSHMVFMW